MIQKTMIGLAGLALITAGCTTGHFLSDASKPSPAAVKALTKKVADWQIETFEDQAKYRALSSSGWRADDGKHHEADWANAALYSGMDQWRKVADHPEKYTRWLKRICERNAWKLYGDSIYNNLYHADTHLVGLTYLSLYEEFQDPAMLKPMQQTFETILEHPSSASLEHVSKKDRPKNSHDYLHRWSWCDALYMAPPVWARLAKVTGDRKYLDFMDKEYHATYDVLWSEKDHLFYRDTRFFTRFEKNGKPLFWSRGNGWVFGGLALMIPDLPEDWEGRAFYVDLFKKMAESIKNCQRADGTWSMGLLGGVAGYPVKETSGTAFHTFAFAWGINNGLLDRETYEPVVFRAWNALTKCVTDEGMLSHVQPIGASPGDSFADKTEVYGIGAFLAAGSEVYKLVGGKIPDRSLETPVDRGYELIPFMEDGGWCWYQDPRAIIHDGKLFVGAIKGSGSGPAQVGIYDLKAYKPLGTVLMHDNFDRDDHNAPAFHVRPDGSVLAVYARHSHENVHYSRISDPADPLKWSAEVQHEYAFSNPRDKVTYMNLVELKAEGLLYNFFRGIDYNPTFVTSADHGETWSDPVHFFQNEVGGRQRPYARYTGNGKDTVFVSITDAHPRNYGNSLYYFEFRDGNFYKADGTLIKNLKADGPLRPSEAETVFLGSGVERKGRGQSAPNSAWTSSIAIDAMGHPHMGYTLYLDNDDHRYRLASWNGAEWIDREVAYGGKCLYERESSYTGLITLDPVDPEVVFISTDVNPSTGEDTGGKHEIYRARIKPEDDITTIQWEAVTRNSPVRNIRPVILRDGDNRVVLWNRGRFNTYTDYDLDTVGFVEKVAPNKGPFLATGIKIGEVDQTSAIVWARLTRNPKRVGSDAPVPEVLYLNDKTGEYEPMQGRKDRIPKVIYPEGATVETIEGATPGANGRVRLKYRQVGAADWRQAGWATVDPAKDYTHPFSISGLTPGADYELKVEAAPLNKETVSAAIEGSFKTAPAADTPADINFIVTTGTAYKDKESDQGYQFYKSALKLDPEFFVHTGDILYYDYYAKTKELALWGWARQFSLPNHIDFQRQVASYFIKDDHDTWMNDCYPGMKTRFMGEFTYEQGTQIFLWEVPMGDKTYRTVRWGKDLQIWMVEGRDFRSPNDAPDGPGKTIWGKPQMDWFKSTVEASDATFKVLISPTPIVGPDRKNKKDNHANSGFAHEGAWLRDFISQQKNMVSVCGDRHWQYVSKDRKTGLMEFCCGPGSDAHAGGWSNEDRFPEHLYLNVCGGFLEGSVDHLGGEPRLVFRHYDPAGKLLHEHVLP